ncbi:dodecin family protein [Natronospira bacteriovora]|uniref:Dodecin family protein n=1 Tax=Natronospira bacteriovora TaxID=3069753 RepID=A0ABU0W567_9GAMM|nr:dodecin family protein [Natronospira sp. AB-CW4]MDQ2069053.1 dodecin family protein [Natronospira sp. AB-CW4]
MTVAKIIEISATSNDSFEDAIRQGIDKASKSVDNIKGAWVAEQKVTVENGKISGYRVDMRVTFVLN